MRERFTENEPESIDLSYFAYAIFPKFPDWIRKQVREEQEYTCAYCGQRDHHLEVHHIKPKSLGGQDTINNSIGLCGPSVNDCHELWDSLALQDHVIYPGVPMDEKGKQFFKKGAHR